MPESVQFQFLDKRINAKPADLAGLAQKLLRDTDFRTDFQQDPGKHLAEAGIDLPDDISQRFAGKAITRFIERGGDPTGSLAPGEIGLPEDTDPVAAGPAVVAVAAVAAAIASTTSATTPGELFSSE